MYTCWLVGSDSGGVLVTQNPAGRVSGMVLTTGNNIIIKSLETVLLQHYNRRSSRPMPTTPPPVDTLYDVAITLDNDSLYGAPGKVARWLRSAIGAKRSDPTTLQTESLWAPVQMAGVTRSTFTGALNELVVRTNEPTLAAHAAMLSSAFTDATGVVGI